jgi:hypothetical protein
MFRCETPVFERSTSGYRIAPNHLIFTEPTKLRAAARVAITSQLAVKPRRHRAWRFHGRHRVRKRSGRVAVASFPLLDAAAYGDTAAASPSNYSSPSPPLDSSAPPKHYALYSPPQQYTLGAPTVATACGNAAAASTSYSFSMTPPFNACATVAAASPAIASLGVLGAAVKIYISRFRVFFVFSTYCPKIRSGPMAFSDLPIHSRGEGNHHHAAR